MESIWILVIRRTRRGHENPANQVCPKAKAPEQSGEYPTDPDHSGVDFEIFGDPSAHSKNFLFVG